MNEFEQNKSTEETGFDGNIANETPEVPVTPDLSDDTTEENDVNSILQDFEEQSIIEELENTENAEYTAEQPEKYNQYTSSAPEFPKAPQGYPQQGFEQQRNYAQAPQPHQIPQPPYGGYAPQQNIPPQQQPPMGYGAPQNPNPYMNQPYRPQMPADYYNPYPQKAPKQKMSGGLKALVIIIISILVACVLCLSAYLACSYKENKQSSSQSSNDIFGGDIFGGDIFGDLPDGNDNPFGIPDSTAPTFTPEQSDKKSYDQSDASDKTNSHFKGIELEKKPKDASSDKYDASYTYNAVENAVVGIACYYEEDKNSENYQSQGTGIIITSDGYIVTNSHVIGNSRKAYLIKVITADKKEYDAGVVGYDSRSDLAVLKIEGKNLPVAKFGDSAYTQITEEVIAIGNPSGIEFQNSVTRGIVSALDREVSTNNNVTFIQTDAAINPGNSGGPLCNMYGQVIGINTAKIASESFEGMGFAIPSATVKKIVDDIIRNSYVTNRVKVGITGLAVYESQAGADGIQIVDITKDGPMDGTGAQKDDIITEVDGEKTTTFAEIFDVLEKHKEGDKVKIKLYRPSEKKTIEIEVKLQMDKADE